MYWNKFKYKQIFPLIILLIVSNCAGRLPVPGGTDSINQFYYTSEADFLSRVDKLQPSMSEEDVFWFLGHKNNHLIQLERNEILNALYGSSTVIFQDGIDSQNQNYFVQSLYGYKLYYKMVEREHGFSSPIRIRTDETGFDYTLTLIFRENALFSPPLLTGGIVNQSSSRTFFDYLSPSIINDRIFK